MKNIALKHCFCISNGDFLKYFWNVTCQRNAKEIQKKCKRNILDIAFTLNDVMTCFCYSYHWSQCKPNMLILMHGFITFKKYFKKSPFQMQKKCFQAISILMFLKLFHVLRVISTDKTSHKNFGQKNLSKSSQIGKFLTD